MLGVEARPILVLARKELRDRLRNRWVLATGGVFTAFALVIAYFGAAQQGALGFHGIEVTIASLVSLVIYLVPLIALILGFDAIVGERERGSLDLLLTMPLTRPEALAGKFLGLSGALAVATIVGFGVAGAILAWRLPAAAALQYALFVLSSVLLGMAFLAIGLLVSVLAADRGRASGAAIALWFFFVLAFDLLLLGVLAATGGSGAGAGVFPFLLLLNPADVYRVLNVATLEGLRVQYGLATVFPDALARPGLLLAVMLAWIAAPLSLAFWRFR